MQLKFQISQIPQGNSLCTKRKARVINTIFLMRKRKFTTERSPCIQKKPEKSTLCVFVKINHTNLVSWSCGKNELTIRTERKAVHFSSVSINWVAWLGSIVRTSIPDIEFLIISTDPKRTHGADARRHPLLLPCALWRWSSHPQLSLSLGQHWCPTGRQCDHLKHSVGAHWDLGSKKACSLPSDVHRDASLGCTLQKGLV